jgi:hypothetical protein
MYEHEVTPETCKRKCGGDFNYQHLQWFFRNPDPGIPESQMVRTVLNQLQLSILFEIIVTISYYYYYYYYLLLGTVFPLQGVVL